jgi:ATP-dependent DNA ligase
MSPLRHKTALAFDEQGRSSFQLLQGFDLGTERPPIFFYAFDLLQLNGGEMGSDLPSISQARKLAETYKRPFPHFSSPALRA